MAKTRMEQLLDKITIRQKVLLKLLTRDKDVFSKRTFVPSLLSEKEWKYCNSLVHGNCLWFGGRTTRKETTERAKVHKKELGLDNQTKLITHENPNHTRYRMHRKAIKKYLLTALSNKYNMRDLIGVIKALEKDYKIKLRDYVEVSV